MCYTTKRDTVKMINPSQVFGLFYKPGTLSGKAGYEIE
jgi:hypothetical protein